MSSDSIETVLAGMRVATPSSLSTRAGTPYPSNSPLTATLRDARGVVAGVPVTFTLPSTGARGTFPDGSSTVTVTTNSNGTATAPGVTAGTVVGTFHATISTEGATDTLLPMAAQYVITSFLSPLSGSGTTTTSATGTVPLKTSALLADDTRLSDAAAAALVASGRVQVRWRELGTTSPWSTRPNLARYDATKDFFQADLKASAVGWTKGKRYTVTFRILPAASDAQPSGDVLQGVFDLGSRSATIQVK